MASDNKEIYPYKEYRYKSSSTTTTKPNIHNDIFILNSRLFCVNVVMLLFTMFLFIVNSYLFCKSYCSNNIK